MPNSDLYRRALLAVTAGALAACGGGGGGGGPALDMEFGAPTQNVSEEGGSVAVLVTLVGPAQSSLGEAASVQVVDLGSGTATSGGDYAAFATASVTFPAGSQAGAQQSVSFTPLDDSSIEGTPETVVLGLTQVSGAGLGAQTTTTLSLLESEQATLRFSSASGITPDESAAGYPAQVQLVLPSGTSLDTTVSVDLGDTGTGTASAGADYSAVPDVQISFAAGTPHLTIQSVTVSVLADSSPEGDESVRLALSSPSPGAKLGGTSLYQLVISDDDVPSGPFLYASEGPAGVENPMAPEYGIWVGSQGVGLGPNTGSLVRISNIGTALFSLAAPLLGGSHPQDFSIEIESAPLPASLRPLDVGAAGFELPIDMPAPVSERLEQSETGIGFDLDAGLLGALELMPAVTLHGFPLPARGDVTLALTRVPLPFSDDAVLRIDGVDQPGGPRSLLAGISLWSGTALEQPGSRVFLAFTPQGAQGFIELAEGNDRMLHVVTERSPESPGEPARVRVAEEWQLASLGVEPPMDLCAGAPVPPQGLGQAPAPPSEDPPPLSELTVANCRLAIETDYQLYQKFGNATALTNYVTALIAAVADRYTTDAQVTLSIAYLGVYTTAGDPWTSQDGGGNAGDLLDEFQAAWNGSGWPASAALAHFISGANLGGGVAYVGVLCNSSFGYGVSGNVNGNINWGAWSGASASFTWDFVVVAHELGHNFGTGHTHSYCPPLDQCYANCSGTTSCGLGTLMSYCHLCAGGMNNIRLQFHPVVANTIRNTVNSSCLGYSLLGAGEYVQYLVRFEPKSAPGLRTATLDFSHGAPNQPSPLRINLAASAEN